MLDTHERQNSLALKSHDNYMEQANEGKRMAVTVCPICNMSLLRCDYSPLYGNSWLHPEDDLCEWGGKLIFEAHIKERHDKNNREKEDRETNS
jgi:hypothetical protein